MINVEAVTNDEINNFEANIVGDNGIEEIRYLCGKYFIDGNATCVDFNLQWHETLDNLV